MSMFAVHEETVGLRLEDQQEHKEFPAVLKARFKPNGKRILLVEQPGDLEALVVPKGQEWLGKSICALTRTSWNRKESLNVT